MTATEKNFYSRCLLGIWLLACVVFSSSCERRPVVEEDIRRDATVRAIEQVIPSVVNIATAKLVDYEDLYGGLLRQYLAKPKEQPNSVGSGVIIDESGYVLTSLHVVENTSRIQVQLWDGRLYDCDGLVGTPYSDVALLKIRAKPGEKFKVIKLARDDDVLLGETVLALGDPLALGGTVTKGILSSKARRLSFNNGPLDTKDWLQTDAAINDGNSGGPLINLRGEMIGLNVAYATNKFSHYQGIGFAIPVKQVELAISQFFRPEVTDALWFGAAVNAGRGSLRVDFVQPNGPAEKAGLRVGDEILQVNDQTPIGPIQFNRALCGRATNQNWQATLVVARQGQHETLKVKMVPFENLVREKLGLSLHKLTAKEISESGIPATIADRCLHIDQVDADGPAQRAQLQPGFLVADVDNEPTADLLALANILSTKKTGDPIALTVGVRQITGANTMVYRQGTVNVIAR